MSPVHGRARANVTRICPDPLFASNAVGRAFATSGALSHVISVLPSKVKLPAQVLPLSVLFRVYEVDRCWLRVLVGPERPRIDDGPAVLGADFKAVSREGEPVPHDVRGGLAVAFRLGRGSASLQRRLGRSRCPADLPLQAL